MQGRMSRGTPAFTNGQRVILSVEHAAISEQPEFFSYDTTRMEEVSPRAVVRSPGGGGGGDGGGAVATATPGDVSRAWQAVLR